jgi:hypothetical protein
MASRLCRTVACLVALLVLWPALAGAQEEGYPFKLSNFRIEVMGSWGRISPANLNRGADHELAYLEHYYLKYHAYYENLLGDGYRASYSYTSGQTFRRLESIAPVGASIRYQVSPTFALSLGVLYLKGVRTSSLGLEVAVEDSRLSQPYTDSYRNEGFQLSVEAWMPQLGAHFGWNLGRLLRTEIFLLGGPIMGDCRIFSPRREYAASPEGTIYSSRRTMELTGRSNSIAIELGGQLRLKLLSFVDVFGQAGYAFRKLTRIHGLHTIHTHREVPTLYDSVYAKQGTWGIGLERAMTPWGEYRAPMLTTDYSAVWSWGTTGAGSTVANVDLSGFQFGAGLSVRL